jgi:putative sigma-54 modulation protein
VQVSVLGHHIDLTDSVRRDTRSKIDRLSKFFGGMEEAEVLYSDGKKGHYADAVCCEMTLRGHGHVVRAEGVGASPDAALEVAIAKTSHQLTKLKDQLVGRSRPRHGAVQQKGGAVQPKALEPEEDPMKVDEP